jgi:hypothetical protein
VFECPDEHEVAYSYHSCIYPVRYRKLLMTCRQTIKAIHEVNHFNDASYLTG